ncbi:hypothetical protein O181_125632 [Austropuccinia psidii MF-1]|uniref:Uncharacterized protein n=1 Tax=Austropuccinia psidii MF-1 TaxID=1389203 RepID=A0A9Q3KUC9_9BASI|nr:hypothetical protein [Austropuccinia psidii MF-1]
MGRCYGVDTIDTQGGQLAPTWLQVGLPQPSRRRVKLVVVTHRRNRILVLPSNSIEFASRSPQLEVETPPAQYDDHRRGEEEVSLLSPWRIHPSIGDKQKEKPSSRFLFLLALPLHPTTPPGRKTSSLDDSNDCGELREGIWTEDRNDGVLESPTRAAHDLAEEKSLLKEIEGSL